MIQMTSELIVYKMVKIIHNYGIYEFLHKKGFWNVFNYSNVVDEWISVLSFPLESSNNDLDIISSQWKFVIQPY